MRRHLLLRPLGPSVLARWATACGMLVRPPIAHEDLPTCGRCQRTREWRRAIDEHAEIAERRR